MANLPVAFAELIVGGVLTLTGLSQSGSIADTLKGNFSLGLGSLGSGVSTSSASSSNTSGPTAVGQVKQSDLGSIAASHGWGLSEVDAWMKVINKESGGNPQAVNSSSGASGIAQFINGFGEYAQYGGNASTINGQLTAMANYIKQRYDTPSAAWQHEVQYGWY